MGLADFFRRLMGRPKPPPGVLSLADLARRLGMDERELCAIIPAYRALRVPKRSGGMRQIAIPAPPLLAVQRRILRRLLRRLKCHAAAHGFERGRSIVTNALPHTGQAVVVRLDLKNFFQSTSAERLRNYFYKIGWNKEATGLLLRLCSHEGGLPQGAPTSPRLSNLVNYRLDARLQALADKGLQSWNPEAWARIAETEREARAVYTRYADDLTFSFPCAHSGWVRWLIWFAQQIVEDEGYELHLDRKLQVRRRQDRQTVTGLVVNERVNLPRETRRLLRAIDHHQRTGRPTTCTPAQMAGWRAFEKMVSTQSSG
jgi:RNA-directed DNA polymerase